MDPFAEQAAALGDGYSNTLAIRTALLAAYNAGRRSVDSGSQDIFNRGIFRVTICPERDSQFDGRFVDVYVGAYRFFDLTASAVFEFMKVIRGFRTGKHDNPEVNETFRGYVLTYYSSPQTMMVADPEKGTFGRVPGLMLEHSAVDFLMDEVLEYAYKYLNELKG